jgi:ABC-type sugar transport system permease subunit
MESATTEQILKTSHKIAKLTAPARAFREAPYWGLLLISPWLAGFVLFKLVPIGATLVLSFTDLFLLEPSQFQFVGLASYGVALRDVGMWTALWRTLQTALWIIPLQTVGGILVAAILSNKKLLFKNTVRALFFLPSIIPSTAFAFMWQGFVNPRSGWLTRLLLAPFGLQMLNIFTGRGSGQALFILTALWTLGPGMLILMGAMQSVPNELYEAALIDGASRLRQLWHVTLPLTSPAIFFTLVLNLTGAFGGALLLDRGYGINNATSSFDGYIYFTLFRVFHVGEAASQAWIFFIFVTLIVLILFRTAKYWVYYPDHGR